MNHLSSLIFAICSILSIKTFSQTQRIYINNGCNFSAYTEQDEYYANHPSDSANIILNEILSLADIPDGNFIFKSANVGNALATESDGKRYILYSSVFLSKIKEDSKSKWAVYSLLAHEIAHHVLGHNLSEKDPKRRKELELQADEYSGRILNTLCASKEDAIAAISTMDNNEPGKLYPPWEARKEAVFDGWIEKQEDWHSKGGHPCESGKIMDLTFGNKYKHNRAKNIRAELMEQQMKITYDAFPKSGHTVCETFIVSAKNVRLSPQSLTWENEKTKYGENQTVIWHFAKDGYTKEQVEKPEELGITVFQKNKTPVPVHISNYFVWGTGVLTSTALIGQSFNLRRKALEDYEVYRVNTNPNDPIWEEINRAEYYNGVDRKYVRSQYLLLAGGTAFGICSYFFTKKIGANKQHNLGNLYSSRRTHIYLEPIFMAGVLPLANIKMAF